MDHLKRVQELFRKSSVLSLSESVPSDALEMKAFQNLLSHAHSLSLDANEMLIRKGEHGDRFYLVESGSIVAFEKSSDNNNVVLHEFHSLEGFGEKWLLFEHHPALTNLRAGSNGAKLVSISRESFQSEFAPLLFVRRGPFRGRIIRAKIAHEDVKRKKKNTLALNRDVCDFRGIRYASKPTRLSLPHLMDHYSSLAVLDCFEYGPECAQISEDGFSALVPKGKFVPRPSLLEFSANMVQVDEDCLCLNVVTPLSFHNKSSFPVMVFVHGGAFVTGSGSIPLYDGRELSSKGVVLVTINYRLGALGFLAGVEGVPMNLGLHDQVCALRWVKRHIAQFGGDPENITVFGESAGAMSTTSLLGMSIRREEKLFSKAILQSGAGNAVLNESLALLVRDEFCREMAQILKVDCVNVEMLNSCPIDAIVQATSNVSKRVIKSNVLKGVPMAFQPCVLENGPLFKDLLFHSVPPLVNIARGIADDVSILVGVNNSEYTLFMLDGHWRKVLHQKANSSRSKFKTLLCSLLVNFTHKDTRYRELPDLHERAQKVVDFYLPVLNGPEKDSIDDEEAYFAFERIHSVWIFDLAADHLLTMKQHDGGQHTQTLSYRVFSHSPIGDLKACHALELPLVFGTFKTPLGKMLCGDDADAQETSWDMMDHWVNFARGHQFSTKERAFGGGKAPLPGSIFVSLAEKQVWEGFMEKVELDYTMVRKRNAKL